MSKNRYEAIIDPVLMIIPVIQFFIWIETGITARIKPE